MKTKKKKKNTEEIKREELYSIDTRLMCVKKINEHVFGRRKEKKECLSKRLWGMLLLCIKTKKV